MYTRAFFCDSSREPRASTRLVVCLSGWDVSLIFLEVLIDELSISAYKNVNV